MTLEEVNGEIHRLSFNDACAYFIEAQDEWLAKCGLGRVEEERKAASETLSALVRQWANGYPKKHTQAWSFLDERLIEQVGG